MAAASATVRAPAPTPTRGGAGAPRIAEPGQRRAPRFRRSRGPGARPDPRAAAHPGRRTGLVEQAGAIAPRLRDLAACAAASRTIDLLPAGLEPPGPPGRPAMSGRHSDAHPGPAPPRRAPLRGAATLQGRPTRLPHGIAGRGPSVRASCGLGPATPVRGGRSTGVASGGAKSHPQASVRPDRYRATSIARQTAGPAPTGRGPGPAGVDRRRRDPLRRPGFDPGRPPRIAISPARRRRERPPGRRPTRIGRGRSGGRPGRSRRLLAGRRRRLVRSRPVADRRRRPPPTSRVWHLPRTRN